MARFSLRRLLGPKLPIPGRLHVCTACGSDFMNPTRWDLDADGRRRVGLRCGACGHESETTPVPTAAALFEAAHANRIARMTDAATRLERERMAGWVESFSGALERDLIDATDF